jgi:hypothetical protein
MAAKLLNNFLLGADPEMVLLNPPDLVNGLKAVSPSAYLQGASYYGFDHNGMVLEPHPKPNYSARMVCRAIKDSMDVIHHHFGNFRQRAGAYLYTPQRQVTLGGHVHLDLPSLSTKQIHAMDVFTESLERLDILPTLECAARRSRGEYGRFSDIRAERGRVEYRSMCSWLFSRKASMLAITGIKLCAVAPQTLKLMTSNEELRGWFEVFKGSDDDVDWILDRGYFDRSLVAEPDANLMTSWKSDPGRGSTLLKASTKVRSEFNELAQAQQARIQEQVRNITNHTGINPELAQRLSVTEWYQAREDFLRAQRQQRNAGWQALVPEAL